MRADQAGEGRGVGMARNEARRPDHFGMPDHRGEPRRLGRGVAERSGGVDPLGQKESVVLGDVDLGQAREELIGTGRRTLRRRSVRDACEGGQKQRGGFVRSVENEMPVRGRGMRRPHRARLVKPHADQRIAAWQREVGHRTAGQFIESALPRALAGRLRMPIFAAGQDGAPGMIEAHPQIIGGEVQISREMPDDVGDAAGIHDRSPPGRGRPRSSRSCRRGSPCEAPRRSAIVSASGTRARPSHRCSTGCRRRPS